VAEDKRRQACCYDPPLWSLHFVALSVPLEKFPVILSGKVIAAELPQLARFTGHHPSGLPGAEISLYVDHRYVPRPDTNPPGSSRPARPSLARPVSRSSLSATLKASACHRVVGLYQEQELKSYGHT
jgi:hypothetical protein